MTIPTTVSTLQITSIGVGINTFTGSVLPSAVSPSSTTVSLGLSSQSYVQICDSVESFNKATSTSAGVTAQKTDSKGNTTGPSVGVTAGPSNTLNVTDTSVSVVIYAKAETSNVVYDGCSLSPNIAVPATTEESLSFYQQYGDSYVAGLTEGGEYTAVFVFNCQTEQDQKVLKASLSANGAVNVGALVGTTANVNMGASLSGGLTKTLTTSNVQCSIYQSLVGSTSTLPSFDNSSAQSAANNLQSFVESIVNFALNFSAASVTQPVAIACEVQGYETLFGSSVCPGFQNIAANRDLYAGSVLPNLITLQSIQTSYNWIQQAYSTYGYNGDSTLTNNYAQLTSDINGLTDWLNVNSNWQTGMFLTDAASGGFSLAEFNGLLVMAFIGEYQQITVCTSPDNGQNWSYPTIISDACSNYPPALAVFDNQVCLAYTGLNNGLYTCVAGANLSFSTPAQYGTTAYSFAGPTLAAANNMLYLAYTATNSTICLASSSNGTLFKAVSALPTGYASTSNSINPTLAVSGNYLYLAFSANSSTALNCLGYGGAAFAGSSGIGSFGTVSYVATSGAVGGCLSMVGAELQLYGNVDLPSILYAAWVNNGEIVLWNQATNNCSTVVAGGLPSLAASGNALMLAYVPPTATGSHAQISLQALTMPTVTESLINGTGGIALTSFNGVEVMAFIGAYTSINVCQSADGGQTWGGATVLDRVFSNYPPALAVLNGVLYLAYTGLNNGLYVCSSSDGVSFTQPVQITGISSNAGPALAMAGGMLYLAYTSTNNSIALYSSSNGTTFASATTLPSGYLSASASIPPALAVVNGNLYLAFAGSNGLEYGSATFNGTTLGSFAATPTTVTSGTISGSLSMVALFGNLYATWSNGNQVVTWNGAYDICSDVTAGALPALAAIDGSLVTAYVNTTGGTAQISFTTVNVSYPFCIPTNASGGICQVQWNDQLVMAYIGAYQEITVCASSDGGQTWDNPVALKGMTSNYPPALAVYNNQLCLAYTGLDNYIYASSSSDAISFLFPPVVFNQSSGTPNSSYAGPSLAVADTLLYLAFTGTNSAINIASSTNGTVFGNQASLTNLPSKMDLQSTAAGINPSLAVMGGYLWLAYSADDPVYSGNCLGLASAALGGTALSFYNIVRVNAAIPTANISLAGFSEVLYAAWQTTDGIGLWNGLTNELTTVTGTLPSLSVYNKEILLAYAPDAAGNTAQSVSLMSINTPILSNAQIEWNLLPLLSAGTGGYAFAEFFGQRVMVSNIVGNEQLYLSTSSDQGQTWDSPIELAGMVSPYPPALAVFNDQLCLAYTATSGEVYVAYASNAESEAYNDPTAAKQQANADLMKTGKVSQQTDAVLESKASSVSLNQAQSERQAAGNPANLPAGLANSNWAASGKLGSISDEKSEAVTKAKSLQFDIPILVGGTSNPAKSSSGPALAVADGVLYLAYQKVSKIALVSSTNGTNFSTISLGVSYTLGTDAVQNPALAISGNTLYLAFTNSGGLFAIGFATLGSTGLSSFYTPLVTSFNCAGNLNLTAYGNNLLGTWTYENEIMLWNQAQSSCIAPTSGSQPAFSDLGGVLAMACSIQQDTLTAQSLVDGTWSAPSVVSGVEALTEVVITSTPDTASESTSGGYALTEWNNSLWMAYIGSGQQIFLCSSANNGQAWSAPIALTGLFSNFPPTLAGFGNQLCLAFTANGSGGLEENTIYACTSTNGSTFSTPTQFGSYESGSYAGYASYAGPSMAVANGVLYLAFINSEVALASSTNGTGFDYSQQLPVSIWPGSAINPALTAVSEGLACAVWNSNQELAVCIAPYIFDRPGVGSFGSPAVYDTPDACGSNLSLATMGGNLYAAWQGWSAKGDELFIKLWNQPSSGADYYLMPDWLAGCVQPCLASVNGGLMLVYGGTANSTGVGTTNLITVQPILGNEEFILGINPPAGASGQIATVVFNSLQVMAYVGANQQIFVTTSSDNGQAWAIPSATGLYSNLPLALCVFNNQLYLAFTANGGGDLTANPIYLCASSNGWVFGDPVATGVSSLAGPSMAVANDTLYLAYTADTANIYEGSDEGYLIYLISTMNGTSFSNSLQTACIANSPTCAPALAIYNGTMWLAYTSTSSLGGNLGLGSCPLGEVGDNSFTGGGFFASSQPNGTVSLVATSDALYASYQAGGILNIWNLAGNIVYTETTSNPATLCAINNQAMLVYTGPQPVPSLTTLSPSVINPAWTIPGFKLWNLPAYNITSTTCSALTVFNGLAYLAYTSTNNVINLSCSSDGGETWGSPTTLTSLSSPYPPALAVFNNQLYLAYTNSSDDVMVCASSDGSVFSSPINLASSSNAGPSLTVAEDTLYLAYVGSNKAIYLLTSSNGTSYGTPTQLPSAYVSYYNTINPALAVSGSTLYVAYAGTNEALNYGYATISATGLGSFNTPKAVSGSCIVSDLSLVELGGTLFASWYGFDNYNNINIVVWNQSTGICNNVQTTYSYNNIVNHGQPTLSVWEDDLVLSYVTANSNGSTINLLPLPMVWSAPWNAPDYSVWTVSGFNVGSGSGYAFAEFNGQRYLAYNAANGSVILYNEDTCNTTQLSGISSACPPALAVYGNQLILAFTSNGGNSLTNLGVYTCVCATSSGVNSTVTPTQFGSNWSYAAPSLAVAGGLLYLGFVGQDSQINLGSSSTGTSFANQQLLAIYTTSDSLNLAMAVENGNLYVAYSAANGTVDCLGLLAAPVNKTGTGIGSFGTPSYYTLGSISGNLSMASAADGGLYVAWGSNGITQAYLDVSTEYSNSCVIASGGSMSNVGLVKGSYVLAFTENDTLNLLLSQGQSWSAPWNLPTFNVWDTACFNIGSGSGFAAAEFGSQMILVFTDVNNNLNLCASTNGGETWGNPVSLGMTTGYPPALAVYNNQLTLAFVSNGVGGLTANGLYVSTSTEGVNFTTPAQVGSGTSSASPSLAAAGGLLYLAYTSNTASFPINLASSSNGSSFGTATALSFNSTSASVNPALAVLKGELYLAFADNSSSAGGNCLGIASATIGSSGVGGFGVASYYQSGTIGGCLSLAASLGTLNAAWEENGNVYIWNQSAATSGSAATNKGAGGQPMLATSGGELVLAYSAKNAASTQGISIQVNQGSVVANPTQKPDLPYTLNPPHSLMIGTPVFNYTTPTQPTWGDLIGGTAYQDINVGTASTSSSSSTTANSTLNGSIGVSVGNASPTVNKNPTLSNTVTNTTVPIAMSNLPVITSINLWGGDYVDQIQISYTSLVGAADFAHGGSGGSASSMFSLPSGDFISQISGIAGDYVNQLSFTATKGQSLTWPTSPSSSGTFSWTPPAGAIVVGFQGCAGDYVNELQPIVVEVQPAKWIAPNLQPLPYTNVLPVGQIGVGYNTFTGSALPNSALASTNTQASQGVQSDSYVKICTSVESLSQTISKTSGFSIGISKASVGYTKTKTSSLNVTDTSVTVVVVSRAVTASPAYTSCSLSSAVSGMDPSAFYAEFGDSFVSSTVNGGEYVAVFVYDCQSVSEQQSVTRSLNDSLDLDNTQVGPSLSHSLSSAQSSNNVNCTCHQSLAGSSTAMPVLTYTPSTDINSLVSFATNFNTSDVNAPVVLSYTTAGYETLLPAGSTNQEAIQAVAANRAVFNNTVSPALTQLYGIQSQIDALQQFYNTYGYTGDPNIGYPLNPDGNAGQVASAINGLNHWVSQVGANPLQVQPLASSLNPPACLANGSPALSYNTPANCTWNWWGTDPTTPFQDINLGQPITANNAGYNTSASSSQPALPLTGLPVISSIQLWGGSWVNQMAVTYISNSGSNAMPSTFIHGQPGSVEADFALNLQPGEYITMIRGTYGDYINQLVFNTNLGQSYSYPSNPQSASGVICWQAAPGEVLVGFQGSSGDYLNQLQPISIHLQPSVWTPPVVNDPSSLVTLPVTGIGVGYNTFTGGAMPNSGIVPPTSVGSQNVSGSNCYYIFPSQQNLNQAKNGLPFNLSDGGNSAQHSKTSSVTLSDTSVIVLVYAKAVAQSPVYTAANPPTLVPAAAGLTPAELFTAYGDSYVSSAVMGAEYIAMIVYECDTETQQTSLMSSFKASITIPPAPPMPSVTIGANFSKSISTVTTSTNVNVRIYQWLNGSATALPNISTTPSNPSSGSSSGNSNNQAAAEDIANVVSFALGFNVSDVTGNGAVLAFETEGYETLMSGSAATAFQPIVNNRTAYTNNVAPNLASLASIRQQMQTVDNTYQAFGYTGDKTFYSHCQQLNADTAALQNWIAQVNANPLGSYSYPNPPQSVTNGMPMAQFSLTTGPLWNGSNSSSSKPWSDLVTSWMPSSNPTNQSSNPTNPANPIPLSQQPVLASITLWGEEGGGWLNQIGTSYQTVSGTVQFVHGGTSTQEGGKNPAGVYPAPALNLRKGEFITSMGCQLAGNVDQLTFATNFGQSLAWPTEVSGAKTYPWTVPAGTTVVGFQGCSTGCMNGVQAICVTFQPALWSSV